MMRRWLRRTVVALAVAFVAVYAGDWAVFKLRGSPCSQVNVDQYVTIPLKGHKQEFDYLGSGEVPCAVALFSQGNLRACWQLRRQSSLDTTP